MRYDLVIVGGGLVGAGLAVALRNSHLRIALIDARMPSNNDARLFALNHSSCQFLQNLDIWSALIEHAAPIHAVHVSRKGKFGAVRLKREDASLSSLGHVVPAKYIEAALNEQLSSLAELTLYRPATLKSIQQLNDYVELTVETGTGTEILEASLVIGADGTQSTVRTLLNIATISHDYQQSALVVKTQLSRSHYQIAYERFVNDGAIAMLPLPNNECATIWTADNATIDNLMKLSETDFIQALQTAFGYRLGKLQNISERFRYPLKMLRANKMYAGRVLLLGNAAHTLHPIAAQGFNLAIYEVAALIDFLSSKTIVDEVQLSAFAEKMQQQSTSIDISHRLTALFSSQFPGMNIVTQLGMQGFDVAIPLKQRLMTKLMGKEGTVPNLLLG
jgi:2-octaprenyl-6-methoxyphenol hydroxylase